MSIGRIDLGATSAFSTPIGGGYHVIHVPNARPTAGEDGLWGAQDSPRAARVLRQVRLTAEAVTRGRSTSQRAVAGR